VISPGSRAHIFAPPHLRAASQPPLGGARLELQTDDPAALRDKVLAAGLPEITHAGHDFYFAAPGGQVFSVEATSPRTTSGAGT
jgi:hypothetical protein